MMNDEYILEHGYKEYPPSSIDNGWIVANFQKRFDDDFGKKYFINIKKWSHAYVPSSRRDEYWKPFSYEYHCHISMFEEDKSIYLTFGTSWTLEEVEKYMEDIFEKMKPNYYESWDETRAVRPEGN